MTGTVFGRVVLVLVALDAVLMAASFAVYPAVLAEGSGATLAWAVGLIVIYAAAGLRIARSGRATPATLTRVVDVAFFVALFLCFVGAAIATTRETRSVGAGIVAAVCSALPAMCITIAAGYAMNFAFVERERGVLAGDFRRSGMRDPSAFVFENALDAAGTHLLEAPIIALVLGGIASAVTGAVVKRT